MYFDAALKVGNHIYLIEEFSGSLVSIHVPSGRTKIEASLPWRYAGKKINVLSWKDRLIICSPVTDHFLVYDCPGRQVKTVELQGAKADGAGFYYSNVLTDGDDLIVLPFKGKTIQRYGIDGELKSEDRQWSFSIDKECDYGENLPGNIRMDSACIVGRQLFFSLIYKDQNYLCKYELDEEDHLCGIAYHSGDIIIRGAYAYPGMVLFRRIFPHKTEIVLIAVDSGEQRAVRIDGLATFEEDIYGDIHDLKIPLKNKIFQLGERLSFQKKIYDFQDSDNYIADGIVYNAEKNKVLIVNSDDTKSYSLKEITEEIINSGVYQEEYKKTFGGAWVREGKYNLWDFKRYITGQMFVKEPMIKNKNNGKMIWEKLYKESYYME